MNWTVIFHDDFEPEYYVLPSEVQDALILEAKFLEMFGPSLGRPQVDTLNASKHSNMKELRFKVLGGVWRVAFAFDPKRKAILLVAGNKGGKDQKRFYKQLIQKADSRFDQHLRTLEKEV